jgi:hypothetical protein
MEEKHDKPNWIDRARHHLDVQGRHPLLFWISVLAMFGICVSVSSMRVSFEVRLVLFPGGVLIWWLARELTTVWDRLEILEVDFRRRQEDKPS